MKNSVTAADLRAIREHLGWSQQRMTEYADGIPIRTYQHWESGDRKPPEYLPRLIIRLLIAEGVLTQQQVDDVLTGGD